ncbi:hypothetical protein CcaCcLH18_07600 [Colletotrichum camelliae]|nr:hypothetical protein CcaCcLH18_07600 [Colletotrichum camelliae]
MTVVKDENPNPAEALESSLQMIDGDIVQAIQALKDIQPSPEPELEHQLRHLILALENYKLVHDSWDSTCAEYPFNRSERQVKDAFVALFPECMSTAAPRSRTKTLMSLKIATKPDFETFHLGPYEFPRVLNGLWQLSSPAWGSGSTSRQEEELVRLVQAGFTAADMADHYGDAELVYGAFRNRLSPSIRSQVLAATKWCVFATPTEAATAQFVLDAVKERYRRLGGRIELLQFHWHDYHDMIMHWGTWRDFQDLLDILSTVAQEHGVSLSNVAARWVLQQPAVGAIIVGTRLGVSSHVEENLATFEFTLSDWDLDRINIIALVYSRMRTRRLFTDIGDCGTEYRNGH